MTDQLGRKGSIHDALRAATLSGDGGPPGDVLVSHNLLSVTHLDTTQASVLRGALVTGQGATPKWTLLAHPGAANKFLVSDADDIGWSLGNLDIASGETFTVVTGGNLALGGHTFVLADHMTILPTTTTHGDVLYFDSITGFWVTGQVSGLISGLLTGGGTDGYVARWIGGGSLDDSSIRDDGTNFGFHGAAPVAQSTGWSVTAGYTADKAFDPETAAVLEVARALGTLIDYLKVRGDLGS